MAMPSCLGGSVTLGCCGGNVVVCVCCGCNGGVNGCVGAALTCACAWVAGAVPLLGSVGATTVRRGGNEFTAAAGGVWGIGWLTGCLIGWLVEAPCPWVSVIRLW